MTDRTDAWVWSQYKGVISESKAEPSPAATTTEERVVPLRPVPSSTRGSASQKSTQHRSMYGVVIGLAVLAGLFFPTVAVLLLLVAALLIASGREPKKVDDFLASIPGGGFVNKALTQFDDWLA